MTRETLGLTRKPIKDAKPVAEEAEAMVEVEGEADPKKRLLNGVAINPAPDISKSSTRREELLLNPKYLDKIRALRRALSGLKPLEGTRKLVELLEKYPTNAELLNNIPGAPID